MYIVQIFRIETVDPLSCERITSDHKTTVVEMGNTVIDTTDLGM